jgi:pimeloyl-ACP methyl ester carboxylesterase
MPRNRTIGIVGLGAVASAVLAARRVERRWASAPDDIALEHRRLPQGEALTVATDDGAELAVTVAGDGPDVVLAHCWTGAREVWAPVAHRLVDAGHRVTMYDQRGHGSSTCGGDGYTIPRLGADLRAVMTHVDAGDAVVAGHSMGGMTIMSLATHHPDVLAQRAKAVVLVATAASGLARGRGDRAAGRVVASPALDRVMQSPVGHALVRGSVGKAVRRHHLTLTRDLFVACPPDARRGLLTAMQAMDLREGIASIGLPTTVVVGTHDRLTPPALARVLADTIPGAELETIDGVGHMVPLEAPEELATLIAKVA